MKHLGKSWCVSNWPSYCSRDGGLYDCCVNSCVFTVLFSLSTTPSVFRWEIVAGTSERQLSEIFK